MPLTLPLPDWMPPWMQLVVLIAAILFGFALLMMPFSVFGLKGRLDYLATQLDDVQAELRMVAARLPDPDRPASRAPMIEELTRPPPTRTPSPARTPERQPAPPVVVAPPPMPVPPLMPPAAPSPIRATPAFSGQPPSAPARQPAYGADPGPAPPPRFAGGSERQGGFPPRPSAPSPGFETQRSFGVEPRQPSFRHGGPAGDWDDQDAPEPVPVRRPLRATTLRDPARDLPRDPASPSAADRPRSEPTLRWPPR